MNAVQRVIVAGYWAIIILFIVCAFVLIGFAAIELWHGLAPTGAVPLTKRFDAILESIALLTIAVASLELGQTILEEEVQRSTHLSAPTRVRRFLSRFMIVIIVALGVECLVTAFQAAHNDPSQLAYAAAIGLAASALLAAWGLFVKLNTAAEQLEPVAMAQVKSEDDRMDRDAGA